MVFGSEAESNGLCVVVLQNQPLWRVLTTRRRMLCEEEGNEAPVYFIVDGKDTKGSKERGSSLVLLKSSAIDPNEQTSLRSRGLRCQLTHQNAQVMSSGGPVSHPSFADIFPQFISCLHTHPRVSWHTRPVKMSRTQPLPSGWDQGED